jgi:hypothetical protein
MLFVLPRLFFPRFCAGSVFSLRSDARVHHFLPIPAVQLADVHAQHE